MTVKSVRHEFYAITLIVSTLYPHNLDSLLQFGDIYKLKLLTPNVTKEDDNNLAIESIFKHS